MNVWLGFGATPPQGLRTSPLPFPPPQSLRSNLSHSPIAAELASIAEAVLRREFSLLGTPLRTEREIRWRRDYIHHLETGVDYFRRIPYLDASTVGDHKIIWELNRHQHLVAMAQASLLTQRTDFLDDLWYQLETWMDQNPFCRGMNWTSALEVAFRALSWLWLEHLVGDRMPEPLRRRWLGVFFQHGQYLQHNLSVYFSPNTHLQGEALALHALGVLFADHPDSAAWRRVGADTLRRIIHTHVRPDGSHFEQSSYYHVYATDMFLFHALLEPVSENYRNQLRAMAGYLWSLASSGELPLLGDDDGGRLFPPYGARRAFAQGCLAACAAYLGDTPWRGHPPDLDTQAAWWMNLPRELPAPAHPSSAFFPDAGVAILAEDSVHVAVDTRAFGFGSAGHSHAHALHFTLRHDSTDVLIDPGTYTYVGEPEWRNRFRGTAAHNTVLIDGQDQATPGGPFRWQDLPTSEVISWSPSPWHLHAACRYRGLCHERHVRWSGKILFILDRISSEGGGQSTHHVEQLWHCAAPVHPISPSNFQLLAGVQLLLPEGSLTSMEEGWYSPAPGVKFPAPVIRVTAKTTGQPEYLAAALCWFPFQRHESLTLHRGDSSITLSVGQEHATLVTAAS